MMSRPLHINPPAFEKARKLTMLELNQLRASVRHTVITPDMLSKMTENQTKVSGE